MVEEQIAVDYMDLADRAPFVQMLVDFGEELRRAGVPVGSGDLLAYCGAMAWLDPGDLLDLYWAGRTTLVTRRDHIAVYDKVFRSFFLDDGGDLPDPIKLALKQSTIEKQSVIEVPATEPGRLGKDEEEAKLGLMASDIEIWRHKSFAACTDDELAALRRIMVRTRVIPPRRRTRRTHPTSSGSRPDLRRTGRTTLRAPGA